MQELLISSEPANFASACFLLSSMPKILATGQAYGLAIEIANAFSSRVGVGEVVTVEYPTPPQVIACVKTGG